MRINIDLSKKSIEKAIKQIKAVQKKVQKDLPRVFLQKCVEWIKAEANNNLSRIPMDYEITSFIQKNWVVSPVVGNKITLSNTAQYEAGKNIAVFVEFGVGSVGQSKSHDMADEANYEYNVPSRYKQSDGKWTFNAHHQQYAIDLNKGYYYIYQRENSGQITAVTKGSPANMYLFKAMKAFETSGIYQKLWEQACAEVIG